MKLPRRSRTTMVSLDGAMTPLIDVVFLLLIFFMCASIGHVREPLVPTDFGAGAVAALNSPPKRSPLGDVWIRLKTDQGSTVYEVEGGEFRNAAELGDVLRELALAAAEIPVILDVGQEVPLGDAMAVYDVCRQCEFSKIEFAVHPGDSPPAKSAKTED